MKNLRTAESIASQVHNEMAPFGCEWSDFELTVIYKAIEIAQREAYKAGLDEVIEMIDNEIEEAAPIFQEREAGLRSLKENILKLKIK